MAGVAGTTASRPVAASQLTTAGCGVSRARSFTVQASGAVGGG